MSTEYEQLWQQAQDGDESAVARVLTLVENGGEARAALVASLRGKTGRAHRIGLAGPPGSGKSTMVRELTQRYREQQRRVGVVAVDPTSPRSGGALLGDRVRMNALATEEGVFFRSLASRGHGGGLSLATGLVVDVLDALGYDPLLIETVGVGQAELDVTRKSHSVVLLLLPGAGDAVQLLKAGLLEVADLLVVNKGDREGADELATLLRTQVHEAPPGDWSPPVLVTQALRGLGVDEVVESLRLHREFLEQSGEFDRRRRDAIREQVRQLAQGALLQRLWSDEGLRDQLEQGVDDVVAHRTDPVEAADGIARGLIPPAS